jgi:hypothetical protein
MYAWGIIISNKHTSITSDWLVACLVGCLYYKVHEWTKKNTAIPEVIREAITRTMVGDYRPHWVRDKKFDDSKCPTHESVIIGIEDYNNQSKNLHIRCVCIIAC